MRSAAILYPLVLLALTDATHAQGIAARNADAVRPRTAETVQPRSAAIVPSTATPAITPSQADVVVQRRAAMVANTAVQGQRLSAWHWQTVGNTGIAGDGVARGSQLTDIRCAGLVCRTYQDSAGAWVIRGEGGFPEIPGRTLEVLVMNARTQAQQTDARERGVFSDGKFWDLIDTGRLPPGSYAVFYLWKEKDRVFASVTFDVLRDASGRRPAAASAPVRDNAALRNSAIQNQRCLGMAATNPDVRCTP